METKENYYGKIKDLRDGADCQYLGKRCGGVRVLQKGRAHRQQERLNDQFGRQLL